MTHLSSHSFGRVARMICIAGMLCSASAYAGPFVGFSFGAVNNSTSVITFNFDFITPYASGPYTQIESVFSDVLIDINFTGTSTVAPVGSSFIMSTYVDGVVVPALDIGEGCTTPVNVFVCTSPDIGGIGPLPWLSAATGTLELKGSFTVTPGSQYTLTGRSELLSSTPEPCTLMLLGSFLGLGGLLRRRK